MFNKCGNVACLQFHYTDSLKLLPDPFFGVVIDMFECRIDWDFRISDLVKNPDGTDI